MQSGQWKSAAAVLATMLWVGIAAAQDPVRAPKPEDEAQQADSRDSRPNRGRGERIPDKLNEGDVAPDFTLQSLDGPETVTLSSFQGKRPVVLIFGSYT